MAVEDTLQHHSTELPLFDPLSLLLNFEYSVFPPLFLPTIKLD
jgi:hypothetical protein